MKLRLGALALLVTGCSSLTPQYADYQILEFHPLSAVLKETSGLYCSAKGGVFTINDSGNSSDIYQINEFGRIVDKRVIERDNIDWEAISGDDKYLYIADIGNNSGKRASLFIHAIPRGNHQILSYSTAFNYFDNVQTENVYRQHDFDGESIVSVDNDIYLFSKSWETNNLRIYQIDKRHHSVNPQIVKPVKVIKDLPGMITGGDYDKINKRFVLVGYKVTMFGQFYPFILLLNKALTEQKLFSIQDVNQVEGLCVNPNGEVWITQEGSVLSSQKLIKLLVY